MTRSSSISEPRVLAIGFEDSSADCDTATLFSSDTLKGFDLVIVNGRQFLRLEGKGEIDAYNIGAYGSRIERRTDELLHQVTRGCALVLLPSHPRQALKILSGVQEYQWRDFVKQWRKLHLGVGLTAERGNHFEAKNVAFERFLATVTNNIVLTHYVSLDIHENMVAGLIIPKSEVVVACAARRGNQDGLVLLLPELEHEQNDFSHFRQGCWQLVQDLRKKWPEPEGQKAMPGWADDYLLPNEETLVEQMKEANERIEELTSTRDDLEIKLRERRKAKRLATAHGKQLERAVEDAFAAFDFNVERPNNSNRTDRIAWDGNRAVVMEIKGRTKGANANNLGQVMRWKSEFYGNHGRAADAALLVINGWRDIPIEERAEKLVFEPNIVEDAEREKIGLITGVQLLGLRIAVESSQLDAGEVGEKIFACVGLFQGFDTITKKILKQGID